MRKRTLTLVIIVAVLGLGGGAMTIYRIFFIRMLRVPTGAMMNTIIPGDHIVATKSFGGIERGQVVVFQYPKDPAFYVARVVGLPGETIHVRGRAVYINERELPEQRVWASYIHETEPLEELSTEGSGPYQVFYEKPENETAELFQDTDFATTTAFRIPANNFFMMGDNRDNSEDSRYRGPVPRDLIWGTASIIYMSVPHNSDDVRWERTFKRIN